MLGVELGARDYLCRLETELRRIDPREVECWSELLFDAWRGGNYVFIFGNGGSATTASHLAEDLAKNCLRPCDLHDETRRRLKVMSLTDNVGWLTAIGNDLGYDQVFVQQLMQYGQPGDLAIAISGSGNSPNVLAAVGWANRHGLVSFGLTGFDGGKLKAAQQAGIHVALDDMAMVESVHLCLAHWVIDDLHARINRLGRHAGPEKA